MKKMRKILSLALAVIMMMAMSITAFADNTKTAASGTATITVNNLEEGIEVNIYKLATVYSDGSVEVEDWAANAYTKTEVDQVTTLFTEDRMSDAAVKDLKDAFTAWKNKEVEKTANASNGTVSFNVGLGAYYIEAKGSQYTYLPMVAVTFGLDSATNKYIAKNATIVAKGNKDDLDKVASDDFVHAGQSVDFTITKTIPSNVTSFEIYDTTTNLSALNQAAVKVTVGEGENAQEVKDSDGASFAFVTTDTQNKFKLDLTSLVGDDYSNQKVTVTYTLTVLGDEGYINTAYYHIPNFDSTPKDVIGYTGKFTLTKYNQDEKTLKGAEFIATTTKKDDNNKDVVYYVTADANGKFTGYSTNRADAKVFTTNDNGEIVVTGLEDVTYHFEETKAPEGYSVNSDGVDVTVSADTSKLVKDTRVYAFSDSILDSSLVKLPFTGGMGTTIFTVLGVAIMAIAAALFFASKRKASK